jgi:hypothetical protein
LTRQFLEIGLVEKSWGFGLHREDKILNGFFYLSVWFKGTLWCVQSQIPFWSAVTKPVLTFRYFFALNFSMIRSNPYNVNLVQVGDDAVGRSIHDEMETTGLRLDSIHEDIGEREAQAVVVAPEAGTKTAQEEAWNSSYWVVGKKKFIEIRSFVRGAVLQ